MAIGPPPPKPIPCVEMNDRSILVELLQRSREAAGVSEETIGEAMVLAGYDVTGTNADIFWAHIRARR